jgi:acyl dehydratase
MSAARTTDLAAEVVALATRDAPLGRTAEVPVSEHAIRTWCAAVGEVNPLHHSTDAARTGITAPPAMLQTWTMPIGDRATNPSLHARVRAATRQAGLSAVVATDYEHEYLRPVRVGEVLTERSWIDAVSGPKDTALGTGRFVTIAFEIADERGDPVGRLRTRTLYFDPATARSGDTARPARDEPGETLAPQDIPLTRTLIIAASLASSDHEPVHHDHEVARAQGLPDIIASIVTTAGLVLAYAGERGPAGARPRRMRLRLARPAVPGDILRLGGRADPLPDGTRLTVHGDHARGRHVTAEVDVT